MDSGAQSWQQDQSCQPGPAAPVGRGPEQHVNALESQTPARAFRGSGASV